MSTSYLSAVKGGDLTKAHTILSGNYLADFYYPKSRLVVEVDGGQYYSAEGKEKDRFSKEGNSAE